MRLRRHGGGEFADQFRIARGQWSHAPGVVIAGGQARQEQTAGQEAEGQFVRGTPERGRPVFPWQRTRACEHRKGGADGQQEDGQRDAFDAAVGRGQYEVQICRRALRVCGRDSTVRSPEADVARARGIGRQEHDAALGQFVQVGG